MLEKCVSNHRHQRVTMKGVPRPFLEVVETEFLLKLLVSLAVCIDLKNHLGHRHVALPGNLFDAYPSELGRGQWITDFLR